MYGIDISNHQKNINLSTDIYDFAIFKATEGVNFIDPSFKNFAIQLTKLNKLIGCYHYARPDNRREKGLEAARMEADWFIKTMKNAELLGQALLILDWEQEPTDNFKWARAWLDRVYEMTKIRPFIYFNTYVCKKSGAPSVTNDYPVWIASWGENKKELAGNPTTIKNPVIPCQYSIIQYTSNGTYPQLSGRIDLDYTDMDKASWIEKTKPEVEDSIAEGPIEESHIEEMLSNDMKWAIENGLFIGATDGLYHPKDPLTREQLATVLRRLMNYYM